MSQRHTYAQEREEQYDKDPEECEHPEEKQAIVVDSIGEVTGADNRGHPNHEEFTECQQCGARVDGEDD